MLHKWLATVSMLFLCLGWGQSTPLGEPEDNEEIDKRFLLSLPHTYNRNRRFILGLPRTSYARYQKRGYDGDDEYDDDSEFSMDKRYLLGLPTGGYLKNRKRFLLGLGHIPRHP
ncbi:unnamed protein product [Calicophoron daubneyi]|uniref:Uncharacterized protein n=1 Tax=Calicophoron daubneyi TaxID=300641 RepID=A0AAV2T261_CALDB